MLLIKIFLTCCQFKGTIFKMIMYIVKKYLFLFLLISIFLFISSRVVSLIDMSSSIIFSSLWGEIISLCVIYLFLLKNNIFILFDNLILSRSKVFFLIFLCAQLINLLIIAIIKT